ncbi:SMP-30/gluconolactonase/LRE family protein [Streptomyces sp. NPDC006739]|uniref:SMP-30/gluconolactonase/LRE family protein n=1 Tax=Streptomyces sp. NPDC006739 TaxID=3364763 RepID=UPI0036B9C6C6
MNDGVTDPAGRFWAGNMAYDGTPGAGSRYRTDPDGIRGVPASVSRSWPRAPARCRRTARSAR